MTARTRFSMVLIGVVVLASLRGAWAQPLGQADRGEPGDEMIQRYLARETARIESAWADDVRSRETWQSRRESYHQQYLYMLGLDPVPERSPLRATVTGSVEGTGYVVEKLHYQSMPGLYVTANLYRPSQVTANRKLPAVLYVCGHSGRGRDGNKTAFQSHGIWFARHGYVCLIVDTLQLGEIAATHHGTYHLGRWWWHSRGYTSAGVECWNGVRGVDYLISRPEVDPERIAVTGISGGGAASFWIAAADPRVAVAVPVSGMADLEAYVTNRVANGHCDCMFLYNAFQWPWTRIAALIAPRPLLFVNSDNDPIFPMDANERIQNRLERTYSLFGAGDRVDSFVSVGGHDYRADIRQGIYRFLNTHLVGDGRMVLDGEIDLVDERSKPASHPIPPERLRVFATDQEIPRDARNTTIDESFVPSRRLMPPGASEWQTWRDGVLANLRRVSFGAIPAQVPPARPMSDTDAKTTLFETEPGIQIPVQQARGPLPPGTRVVTLWVGDGVDRMPMGEADEHEHRMVVIPRGLGPTRWTRRNPPNYVERALALLGTTADTLRIRDVLAVAAWVKVEYPGVEVRAAGADSLAVIAAYAALLEPRIAEARLISPPASHMHANSPAILNVMRLGDVPDLVGLIAPRPVKIERVDEASFGSTKRLYAAVGAAGSLRITGKPE
ncbi:MAG: prolyl oligopeptidase family serine peptidase [Pirellulales bacterium]